MNAPQPYRAPAPPPAVPKHPTRKIAIAANLVMLFMLVTSFGGCMTFAWGSRDGLGDNVAFSLAFLSAIVCLACMAVAIVVYAKSRKVDANAPALSTLGIVFSVLFGLASAIGSFFFWCFTSTPISGFGGWGRPLRLGKRAVTPEVKPSQDWAKGPRPDPSKLDTYERALLRDLWLHDARKEHASVPAFGQVAWQLVALGAPSDLVKRAHISCLQEIDHAERCFALASAYAGRDLGVQEMPALHAGGAALPKNRERALEKVAIEALIDGALLEDYNASLAATALDDVRDPAAREALVRIVEDESAHAALAWDIIRFCVDRGGPRIAKKLADMAARISPKPASLYAPELTARVEALADKSVLFAHGRVDSRRALPVFEERLAAVRATLDEIIAGSSSSNSGVEAA